MTKRFERAGSGWTRSAISIQASGSSGRAHRPDTRKHLYPRDPSLKNLLHPEGASTHATFAELWLGLAIAATIALMFIAIPLGVLPLFRHGRRSSDR